MENLDELASELGCRTGVVLEDIILIELLIEVPIMIKEAYITLSMGVS